MLHSNYYSSHLIHRGHAFARAPGVVCRAADGGHRRRPAARQLATSDPPTHAATGIVWHDEGPWVHNARNRALWGTWRTDEWNPVFLTPVFTALEYVSFEAFGVGTWQARMVPVVSGLAAVLLIGLGLAAASGIRAGLIGASLLATNYVFVMWNRAALMESTMTAFIVASWTATSSLSVDPRSASSRAPQWCWRGSRRPPLRSSLQRSCSMPS